MLSDSLFEFLHDVNVLNFNELKNTLRDELDTYKINNDVYDLSLDLYRELYFAINQSYSYSVALIRDINIRYENGLL